MTIAFIGLPTDIVDNIRHTKIDTYGNQIETQISDSDFCPCRHCLGNTPAGSEYFVLAHRPFKGLNPYTETGPLFICKDACHQAAPNSELPKMLQSDQYMIRAYSEDERIIYGTGRVCKTSLLPTVAKELLTDPVVAFCDIRSASNNCYQCRVIRAA